MEPPGGTVAWGELVPVPPASVPYLPSARLTPAAWSFPSASIQTQDVITTHLTPSLGFCGFYGSLPQDHCPVGLTLDSLSCACELPFPHLSWWWKTLCFSFLLHLQPALDSGYWVTIAVGDVVSGHVTHLLPRSVCIASLTFPAPVRTPWAEAFVSMAPHTVTTEKPWM